MDNSRKGPSNRFEPLTASRRSLGLSGASVDSAILWANQKRRFIFMVKRNARYSHRLIGQTFALELARQTLSQQDKTTHKTISININLSLLLLHNIMIIFIIQFCLSYNYFYYYIIIIIIIARYYSANYF